MLDEHRNIIIFCQKMVMYKVLPKTSSDLKVEKYLYLFDVFKFMNHTAMVCSMKCWVDCVCVAICLNRKWLWNCCSIIVFLVFEKQIVDFKFDFPLLLRW